MPVGQPFGIKVWGMIMVLIGGFASLITVLEIIDSLRFYGLESILIINFASLIGFLVYGILPVMFYAVGVALFMARFWAWRAIMLVIPVLLLVFCAVQAIHVCRIVSPLRHAAVTDFLIRYPDVFLKFLIFYFLLIAPMILYFRQPGVRDYFLLQKP